MAVSQAAGVVKFPPIRSMLPTVPIPVVEVIQSTEITSPTTAASTLMKPTPPVAGQQANMIQIGSNPCAVPIATLSIRELRLRGSSFIRSHASKHGLPNASRKLMKEVIELLKTHYAVVHQQTMLEDDFHSDLASSATVSQQGTIGTSPAPGKIKKKSVSKSTTINSNGFYNGSPTMLPVTTTLVPFQVQMPHDQILFNQVAQIVERLPVDRRLASLEVAPSVSPDPLAIDVQQNQVNHDNAGSPCAARILARFVLNF